MKQVFGWVVASLGLGVLCIVLAGLILSNQWRVQAEVLIAAPPARIHPLVTDLHRWSEWEAKKVDDPSVRYDFEGPAAGPGAVRRFVGQRERTGYTRLTRSEPDAGVWFESGLGDGSPTASANIRYEVDHEVTRVIWTDTGTLPSITGPFLRDSVEKRLKFHLQESLKGLKQRVESQATP